MNVTTVRSKMLSAVLMAMCLEGTSSIQAGEVVLVAGGESPVAALPATESKLDGPFGIVKDSAGQMYVIEISGHRVLKIDTAGTLTRIAGTGEKGPAVDGVPAIDAQFNGMHSVAIVGDQTLYVADTWNSCVRKIDLNSGLITTVIGSQTKGYGGDGGPASAAQCRDIFCASIDPRGERLYFADLENRRVRMIDLKTGIVTNVAGNGERAVPKDGAIAAESPLVDPRAVAVDSQGLVYILERSGNALRVVDRDGKIRTVAGTGKAGLTGDGGDALAATLKGPKFLCCDLDDNVVIADTANHVIRKYLPKTGKIVRVAGTGQKGSRGVGGPPESLEMNEPHGVLVDRDGVLFIVDSYNNRVLKLIE